MKLTEVVTIWDRLPVYSLSDDEDAEENTFTFREFASIIDDVIGVENDLRLGSNE